LAACKVDDSACPHFVAARNYWEKHGYPRIDADLSEAFTNIQKDVNANHCRLVGRFSAYLAGFALHKYRQKNKADREGASGGWRIWAVFDVANSILYPIVVYPKKHKADADDDEVIQALQALLTYLEQQPF
jgi:hypothetical protein